MVAKKPRLSSLSDGTVVLQSAPQPDGGWIVLADARGRSPIHDYVTWIVDAAGHAYRGHYFTDLVAATTDYTARVARGY